MTEIEKKALALVNEVRREHGYSAFLIRHVEDDKLFLALCRAIEQHEAEKAARAADRKRHEDFRQDVSDALVEEWSEEYCLEHRRFARFIIAKPDPLDLVADDMMLGAYNPRREWGAELRAAIEKRGGKIVWGEGA